MGRLRYPSPGLRPPSPVGRGILFLTVTTLLVCAQTPAPTAPSNTGIIEGTIRTNTNPPEPVAGAQVQLNTAQATAPLRGAAPTPATALLDTVTDETGHFIFKDLYPGRYQLRYSKDGFFPMPDGNGVQAAGTTLTQTAGARGGNAIVVSTIGFILNDQPVRLGITMMPAGVISGRVIDSSGRPVVSGQIFALQVSYQDGQRTLASKRSIASNDRGEYRLYGLEPGEYYVRAESRRAAATPAAGQDVSRSYYPGSDDPNRATPIRVASGTETGSVNFSVPPYTALKIVGNVVTPPMTPSPAAPAAPNGARGAANLNTPQLLPNFYLISSENGGIREDGSYQQTYFGTAEERAAGKFELRGVRPGRYDLYVIQRDPDNLQARYAGHTEVNVGNQDVSGITVVLTSGADLRLRFISSDASLLTQSPTQVRLISRNSLPAAITQQASLGNQGAADWRVYSGVVEGQYYLDSPLALLRTAYIADVRQGEKSVYDSGTIMIGSSSAEPVEIVLASPAATVTGSVQAPGGKPAAGTQVVLIPNGPRRQNPLLYKRATSSADGQFTLTALSPGGYKIFAWENLPSGAELNAEFMRAFEDSGVAVTIEAGAQLKVQVPAIPAR